MTPQLRKVLDTMGEQLALMSQALDTMTEMEGQTQGDKHLSLLADLLQAATSLVAAVLGEAD